MSLKPRRRNVAKRTLSKNRIQVQRRRKAKPRLRKNCGQCSSCRSADSCVNLNKSYLSIYHNLFSCVKSTFIQNTFSFDRIFFQFSPMFLFSSIHFQCLYRPDAQSIKCLSEQAAVKSKGRRSEEAAAKSKGCR